MAGAPTASLGCPPCSPGQVSTGVSSAACVACVPPLMASADASACVAGCGFGAFFNSSSRSCVACPLGPLPSPPLPFGAPQWPLNLYY